MKIPDLSTAAVHVGTGACLLFVLSACEPLALAQDSPAPSPVAPPATASPAPADPAPAAGAPTASPTPAAQPPPAAPEAAADSEPVVTIHMPDGQLKSHKIRVYVTRDIVRDQDPRLRLLRSHAITRKDEDEDKLFEPTVVAPGQEWTESVAGQEVRRSGTLLLFDIHSTPFRYKATLRVMPVLSWKEGDSTRIAVGEREVNVASIVVTSAWTVAIVALALLVVFALAWRAERSPLGLLTGVDGHLSLAQAQIACWTVAVGSVVLGYGLIRLEIPEIPTSLLALMGASLATGGVGFFQDSRNQAAALKPGEEPARRSWAWADLVQGFTAGKAPELSLAKAQMLFWTILLLVLFVSKSILDGAIWEVPWPLVALMGFSQAGYLAPKLAPQPEKARETK